MKKTIALVGLLLLLVLGCESTDTNIISDDEGVTELNTDTDSFETPNVPTSNLQHVRDDMFVFGPVRITIFDIECTGDEPDERCGLLDEAFDLIYDMERRWTVNDIGGEVELINQMAGIEAVEVQTDTFYLIEQAVHYSIYSERLFNVAIGPLTSLWNIAMPGARRPSDTEIEAVLPLLDPTRITLDAEASTVFLEDVGMRLDLGGIAKGFMPDMIIDFFQNHDVERALIIIGGEVVALGGRYDGTPFRIGIRNPFSDDESVVDDYLAGTLPLHSQALVTSGTYSRYFADQETMTFYHHLFDSDTGLPFDTDIVSLTIVADTGLLGEVYTKIVFALGVEAGLAYVEAHPGIEAMFISEDRGIYLSTGLQGSFELLLDDTFEMRTN